MIEMLTHATRTVRTVAVMLCGQEWAQTEGNLHRALASKILANYARRKSARPVICIFVQHARREHIEASGQVQRGQHAQAEDADQNDL